MADLRASSRISRDTWLGLGVIAVVAVVFALYFVVYKPFTPVSAARLAGAAADAAVMALLVVWAGGLGRRLLRARPLASPGERILVQAAAGWGVLALGMLALGAAGLYYAAVIWAALAAGAAVLWRDALGWLADLRAALGALGGDDRLSRALAAYVWLALGLGFVRALAPPTAWDALVYHLALPRMYAEAHRLYVGVDLIQSGMPQLNEMLFTAATLLRGPTAAQALGWAFGAAGTLGLAGYAARTLGPRQGALCAAVLYSAPALAASLAWAYADWLLTALSVALLVVLGEWRASRDRRWPPLAGFLAGLAVSCKYTGALVPLGAAGFILAAAPGRSLRARLGDVAIVAAVAAVVFAPWLVKNTLVTGSPTYPLLFRAGYMDAWRQESLGRPDLAEHNPLWALLLGARFTLTGVPGSSPTESAVGPLFLVLPLGLALGARRLAPDARAPAWPIAVYALCGYLGWVGLSLVSQYGYQVRLYYPFFPALAWLGVLGLEALATFDTPALRVSWLMRAVVVFALVLTALTQLIAFGAEDAPAYLVGAQSAADYITRNRGPIPAAMESLGRLPAGSRVVFLWEPRTLYCPATVVCEPDAIIDRWWHERRTVGTAGDIVAHWRSSGVTHVLILDAGADLVRADPASNYDPSDWTELDALRGSLRLVQTIPYGSGPGYSLYALP